MSEEDLIRDLRDAALDQLCARLRRLGVDPEAIAKARAEAIRLDDDAPLIALYRSQS